ncbi:phosphoribosylglycinamide synthetase C domain-containing protein [Anaerolineales bacterium HSG6]|nr:phosphoribosylglycinamide synthetase C domain-containing protein [Anaerolineales bacterium HSG6]
MSRGVGTCRAAPRVLTPQLGCFISSVCLTVFDAGTKRTSQGQILTAGGRVLNVTGVAGDFREALQWAYAGIEQIQFEGAHYRTDIGAKAL